MAGDLKMDMYTSYFEGKDIDLEDEFCDFLMKTKDNFSKLSLEGDNPQETQEDNQTIDDESDLEFMKFIAKLKQDLPTAIEKEYKAPLCLKYLSPLQKQRSLSCSMEELTTYHEYAFEKPNTVLLTRFLFKVHLTNSFCSSDIQNVTPNKRRRSKSLSHDVSLNLFDVETESTESFARKKNIYSQQLYHYFNRKVFNNRLPEDMAVIWSDYLRTSGGLCRRRRKDNENFCIIELSVKVLTSFDRLRDTLLHEMCHAAVWIVNNSQCNHGPLWQTWGNRCKLILPHIDVPDRCHNYEIAYKFTYKCPTCVWKCGRHSKSIKLGNALCPRCKIALILIKSK